MISDRLLATYPIISDQVDRRELRVILVELEKILQIGRPGSIVEFGCYTGTTSLFIRRLLDQYHFKGEYHVYDSFAGLPEKSAEDQSPAGEQFKAGELFAAKKTLLANFKKAGLRPPSIHKGWFSELTAGDVPNDICFAFLDGDYYQSIRDSFRITSGRILPTATIIVDDYANEALPGAARATDEWLRANKKRLRIEASLAIISG